MISSAKAWLSSHSTAIMATVIVMAKQGALGKGLLTLLSMIAAAFTTADAVMH